MPQTTTARQANILRMARAIEHRERLFDDAAPKCRQEWTGAQESQEPGHRNRTRADQTGRPVTADTDIGLVTSIAICARRSCRPA